MISQQALSLVCFGFIDDTDLILNSTDPDISCQDLIASAQEALDTWERLINVTGGALAPEKSHWYLVDVNSDGKYAEPDAAPGELTLHNKGNPVIIKRTAGFRRQRILGDLVPPGWLHA